MRFLWKSQLPSARGKLLPKSVPERSRVTRKERLAAHTKETSRSYVLVVLLWLVFFGTLLYLVLFSTYLALGPWRVTGLSLVSEERFRRAVDEQLAHKYLGLFHRNRFLVRPQALEETLKERFPLVKDVSVRRTFPDGLALAVTERAAIVLWCSVESCAQILEDGSVIPTTGVYQEEENRAHTVTLRDESDQPLRFGPGIFDPSFVPLVLSLRQTLREDFGIATETEIRFASRFAEELRLKTAAGYEIYFSSRLTLPASLSALQLLFDQEIPEARRSELRYIDLRTENRIFYLYQDGTGQTAQPQEVPVPETKKK